MRICDVVTALEEFAPTCLAEEWDSVGLQIGDPSRPCRIATLALDLTKKTLKESIDYQADLIITHHPLLFRPINAIRFDQTIGELIQQLCEKKISFYTAHTNLDSTEGGLNDHLANTIGLKDTSYLHPLPPTIPEEWRKRRVGLGRVGTLHETISLKQLADKLQKALQPEALRIIGSIDHEVRTVAVCSGSGGSLIPRAIESGADCFVTGDVKYHQAREAEAAGMGILDVGHYATEIASVSLLQSVLSSQFENDLKIIPLESDSDPLQPYRP